MSQTEEYLKKAKEEEFIAMLQGIALILAGAIFLFVSLYYLLVLTPPVESAYEQLRHALDLTEKILNASTTSFSGGLK